MSLKIYIFIFKKDFLSIFFFFYQNKYKQLNRNTYYDKYTIVM